MDVSVPFRFRHRASLDSRVLEQVCRFIVTGHGGMKATAQFWGGEKGYLAFLLALISGARDDSTSALHGVVEGAATSFVSWSFHPLFGWLVVNHHILHHLQVEIGFPGPKPKRRLYQSLV